MRSMKKVAKKLQQSLSILLSVAMIITCVPQTAFAAQIDVIDAETEADDVDVVDAVDTTDVDAETEAGDIEGITEEGGDEAEAAENVDAVTEPEIETADVEAEEEGQDEEIVGEAAVEAEVEEDEAEVSYVEGEIESVQITDFTKSVAFKEDAANGKYVLLAERETKGADKDSTATVGTAKTDGTKYFTLKAGSSKAIEVNSSGKTYSEGITVTTKDENNQEKQIMEKPKFTKRFKMNADGSKDDQYISFTVGEKSVPATVTVFAYSGGSGGTATVKLLSASDTVGTLACTITSGAADGKIGTWTVSTAGTYYIVSKQEGSDSQHAVINGIIVQETVTKDEGELYVSIKNPDTYIYNGESQEPTLEVSLGTTKVESGYTVKYSKTADEETVDVEKEDLVNAGDYKVSVTYSGKTKDNIAYTIKPLPLDSDNTTINTDDLSDVKVMTTLKAGEEAVDLTAETVDGCTITYAKDDGTALTAADLANIQDARIVITVTGKGNFTGSVKKRVTIGNPALKKTLNIADLDVGTIETEEDGANIGGSIFSVIPAKGDGKETGAEGHVDVEGQTNKTLVIEGGTEKSVNRLRMRGAGSKEARAIKFKTDKAGTLSVWAMANFTSGDLPVLPLILEPENGEPIKLAANIQTGSSLTAYTHEVEAETTYYLYGDDVDMPASNANNAGKKASVNFYKIILAEPEVKPFVLTLSSDTVTYTGASQRPTPTVKVKDDVTDADPDTYEVKYYKTVDGVDTLIADEDLATEFVDAGDYKVTVTGKAGTEGEERASDSKPYKINKFNLTGGDTPTAQIDIGDFADKKLPITVEAKLNGTDFEPIEIPEADFTTTFTDAEGTEINFETFTKGVIKVKVEAKPTNKNFTGSIEGQTEILEGGAQKGVLVLKNIAEATYTGAEQKPTLEVSYEGTDLTADDYDVTYARAGEASEDLTSAGAIEVTVTGKGEGKEYATKTATRTYRIKAYTLTADNVTVGNTISNGTVNVTVTGAASDTTFAETKDYDKTVVIKTADGNDLTADYVGDVTATVTVTGKGNYDGEVTVVNDKITISNVKETEYVVTFMVKGSNPIKVNYEVGSTIDALPAKVTAALGSDIFEGLYTDSAFTAKSKWNLGVNIVLADTTLYVKANEKKGALYVPAVPTQIYTGADIKPAVVVYAADGTLLKSGKDYKITYAKGKTTNANITTTGATISGVEKPYFTVECKGNYTETIKVEFDIMQANIGSGSTFAPGFTAKISESLLGNGTKALKPLTSLKYKKAMKCGTDYTVTVTGPAAAGTDAKTGVPTVTANGNYTFVIRGAGNFAGEVTKTIMVGDKDTSLNKATIKLGKNIKKPAYSALNDGTLTITPGDGDANFSVTLNKAALSATTDYDYKVVFANGAEWDCKGKAENAAVGKAQLVITAKAGQTKCFGSKSVAINVTGTPAKDKTKGVTVEKLNTFKAETTYTGGAIYQNSDVKLKGSDGKYLVHKTDYTISYKGNVKKGKATMTFTMLPASGYTGSLKETFKINAATLAANMVYESDGKTPVSGGKLKDKVPYTKTAIKPSNKMVLKLGNYVLKEGTDYSVSFKDNKKANTTGKMVVKGKGSLTGSVDVQFDIAPANLNTVNVLVTSLPYKANAKSYKIKLKVTDADGKALAAKKDYTITGDTCTPDKATAYVEAPATAERPKATLTGTGNYEGTITANFSFFKPENKLTAKNTTITVGKATYKNGRQLTPVVTVVFGGKTLKVNEDYVLTWGKNNVAGKNKGSVTVVGQGIYGGTATKKFDIDARDINKADEDKFDKAFYDKYIDENIIENNRLKRIAAEVEGIKDINYDPATNKFTVTLDDNYANVKMYPTFQELFNANKTDEKIEVKYGLLKDTFNEDLKKADEVIVTAQFPVPGINGHLTDSRKRKVADYLDYTAAQLIEKAETKMEDGVNRVAEYMGKDAETVKAYTLEKVEGKTINLNVKMTYKASEYKDDLSLDYIVEFKAPDAK